MAHLQYRVELDQVNDQETLARNITSFCNVTDHQESWLFSEAFIISLSIIYHSPTFFKIKWKVEWSFQNSDTKGLWGRIRIQRTTTPDVQIISFKIHIFVISTQEICRYLISTQRRKTLSIVNSAIQCLDFLWLGPLVGAHVNRKTEEFWDSILELIWTSEWPTDYLILALD